MQGMGGGETFWDHWSPLLCALEQKGKYGAEQDDYDSCNQGLM